MFFALHFTIALGGIESQTQMGSPSNRSMYLSAAPKKNNIQIPQSVYTPLKVQKQDDMHIKLAMKLEEARNLFNKIGENPLESLIMIDALQRLGIEYHFKDDIEAILNNQYAMLNPHGRELNLGLREVALRFRLLRQQGYPVSSDVFNKFSNTEGRFEEELCQDLEGLMELHEASQLSIEGEYILDEAKAFTSRLLNSWLPHLDDHKSQLVVNALKNPYYTSLTKFTMKDFLHNFQCTNKNRDIFAELAKVEFNSNQSLYQEEILHITKWWKDLGLATELKFARDQPVKWYMWPMTALTERGFSWQRIQLAKPISLIYVIDDIFDLCGNLDELFVFTNAVNGWDMVVAEHLPNYMKMCLKAIYDTTAEISFKVYKKHGWNPTESLHKAWARLCNAFLQEAKWFTSGDLPMAENYLDNGIVSSGVHVVFVHLFFLLGEGITKENVDLMDEFPSIISSLGTILRLWDDLGSAKDEDQNGYDGSYVECYMKEHPGTSVHAGREHVTKMISDTWKKLNEACLFPNPFSATFTKAILNGARMVPFMYSFDDNHSLPKLEKHIKSLPFEKIFI